MTTRSSLPARPVEPEEDGLPPVLPREAYAPGVACWHRRFGEGVIEWVNQTGDLVEIRFRKTGETKLLLIEACVEARLIRVAKG